ncbi:MAG: DUF2199 domain-containing protein [Verrucomicrobia bacterium]|nr:DUF2199 domain-containing protein [Verrucomicrobiota bacterium]
MSHRCANCGKEHVGFPVWGAALPDSAAEIPAEEREQRVEVDGDICQIDDGTTFVLARLEIPIEGSEEPFRYLPWIELTPEDADLFVTLYQTRERAHLGPLSGRLDNALPGLEEEKGAEVLIYLRNEFQRPLIRSAFVRGGLAEAMRNGFSPERACEIQQSCAKE